MFGNLTTQEDSLFDQFRHMEREMDDLFGAGLRPAGIRSGARGSFPALNVGALPDRVEVYVFAPGIDPQSLEVSIQQNVLTIASVPAIVSVPLVVMGPPENVSPVVPPEALTDVTVPLPPPPVAAIVMLPAPLVMLMPLPAVRLWFSHRVLVSL